MNATSYLVLLFPLAVTLDMIPGSVFPAISRFVILVSLLGGFAALPGKLSRTEAKWVFLLALLLLGNALSMALSTDLESSAIDFAKQVYMMLVTLAFTFSCRQLATRRVLVAGMIFPAALSAGFILYAAWRYRGTTDVYMKSAAGDAGITLNPIAGMAAMAMLLVSTLVTSWKTRAFWFFSTAVVLWLSGARTTLLAFVLAMAIVVSVRTMGPRNTRISGILVGVLILLAVGLFGSGIVPSPISEFEAAKLTSGRVYLWKIAWDSFLHRPISGWGALTWQTQIGSYAATIPLYYRASDTKLASGAYHNAYLDYLAERGIFVTLTAVAMIWFLMRRAWYLFSIRDHLTGFDRRVAQVAPTLILLIAFRGLAEVSGLMGYANGVDDYLAWVIAGVIVAVTTAVESGEIALAPDDSMEMLQPEWPDEFSEQESLTTF